MKFNLIRYTENFYANYWLIPTAMSLAALICVFGLYELNDTFSSLELFSIQHSESVKLLSIIASTTATMLSVVLSITILVLSIASNQLGPRLLPTFMKQGRTQLIIGTMLGVFVYALSALYILSQFNLASNTIGIICSVGIVFGISSFFLIIYFVHYVCHVIQIDNVLVYLGDEISNSIKRNLKPIGEKADEPDNVEERCTSLVTTCISAKISGYIQIQKLEKILSVACEHNIIIELLKRPGHYVFEGEPLFKIYHRKPIADSLRAYLMNFVLVGIRRTSIQDIEFAFEQLAEIAIRSLSPSMANPFTAINCLDRISYGIAFLNQYNEQSKYLVDTTNELRVITNPQTMTGIVNVALNRLRQQAKDDLSVAIRMLQIFNSLLTLPLQDKIANCLHDHAKSIMDDVNDLKINVYDKLQLKTAYTTFIKNYEI